jgi:hypothetical protein
LIFCAPAGFERYFEWLAAQQAGVEPPHERPAAGRYTRVVGPQVGAEWACSGTYQLSLNDVVLHKDVMQ